MKPRWKEIATCAVVVCSLLYLSHVSLRYEPRMFWMAISYVFVFLALGCVVALIDVHRNP